MRKHRLLNALPLLLALLLVGGGAALIVLGARSRTAMPDAFTLPPVPSPSPRPTTAPPQENNWNTILSRWIEAAQRPVPTPSSTAQSTLFEAPAVTINVAAIATQHPAWQLATLLESDASRAIRFEEINVPAIEVALRGLAPPQRRQIARALASSQSWLPRPAAGSPAGVSPSDFSDFIEIQNGGQGDEERYSTRSIPALHDQARERQMDALDAFLNAAAERQQAMRADIAEIGLAAMNEEIEAAQRLRLDALIAPLPPDAMQLRMTNLRLQLLQNVFLTPEERDAAQLELDRLEGQWREMLREQTRARLAELIALQAEQSQREQESRTQFAASLIRKNERDTQARNIIRKEHQARVQTDFAATDATLSIVLPAYSPPTRQATSPATTTSPQSTPRSTLRRVSSLNRISREAYSAPPSTGSLTPVTSKRLPAETVSIEPGERRAIIQALRSQAQREARQWSRMIARRNGWNWNETTQENEIVADDKTSEVLALLSFR